MKKDNGFYFIPQQWLGDANVMAMDWDCRGIHLHLIAIAWQQDPKGYLIDDEELILRMLGVIDVEDWEKRIKKQVFSAWKKKSLEINGTKRNYWYQPRVLKATENAEKPPVKPRTRRKKSDTTIEEIENPLFEGFQLTSLLDSKVSTTILHEEATVEEKSTIWKIGVSLVKNQGDSDAKARGFIARLIKEYGEKTVATAIAQLSIKSVPPADTHSYLVGILKKQNEELDLKRRGTGRGRVSI